MGGAEHVKAIPLTKGCVAIVDDEDYDRLAAIKWHATSRRGRPRYAASREGGAHLYMHREVLGLPTGSGEVDHVDGDGFNNRRANLRLATHAQNAYGQKVQSRPKSSRFKGVHLDRRTGRWIAMVKQHQRARHLGVFDSEVEAARAYDAAAREAFGDFARLNIPWA